MKRRPTAGLMVALALGSAASGGAQAPPVPPVFRTRVEAVYVDVFVTRSGQPLPGLRASDFELRDNRVLQTVELLSAESRPVLAVLVFDTSSSMEGERLTALRAAGEAFLDGLRPADQAAFVAFSEQITWLAQPTADRTVVRGALQRLRAQGTTSVFDALYSAVTLSDPNLRPLIVLFTDGEDNGSWLDGRQVRSIVERSNALVHVVGWRPPPRDPVRDWGAELPSEVILREVAEASGGRFWKTDSPDRLRVAFAGVADAMRHRYVLKYEATGVKREGWHRIEVKLKSAKGDAQVRRGYWVGR
jgi:Ca-activated chloride channel family protein